jgi:hypothetical protein
VHVPPLPQDPASWPAIVGRPQLLAFLGISRRTLLNYERAGIVPPPVALTKRKKVYRTVDLLAALGWLLGGGPIDA